MTTYKDTLKTFLACDTHTETALAEAIGKTQPTVNRYRTGERFPDAATARAIDAATDGLVPYSVWQVDFMARSGIGQDAAA